MEMEQENTKAVAKRLWKIVRILFYVMKSGMSKSKLNLDLNLILKKSNKAITSLTLRRHRGSSGAYAGAIASITCRSDADVISSAVVLREYEFSCSNRPAAAAVQRVFKLLGDNNGHNNDNESSSLTVAGDSPLVVFPAVRVTDSPFPAREDVGDDDVVDKAAEEFIKRFYKNLKLQKKMAPTGLESPYHCGWDR
ncbi:PREDICTED: uncharacterized protein LOC104814716 [Tarenaya hassleriana]|uniref:uncharacterized protein LOC104814716 n=1 Tax=Tarenaya hassleriana TaxID=28532 RepID=UPI00053C80AF|nr:PREDICTED: uncharacterized protein LOC104814716 [Tarenaya hassleriana]